MKCGIEQGSLKWGARGRRERIYIMAESFFFHFDIIECM